MTITHDVTSSGGLQAIVELLDDKDFQKLAQNPKARAIVEEVHEDRDAFRK